MGYRSWANFLSVARGTHVSAGHAWTEQLDHLAKQCTRSVTRGMGPARQSTSLSVEKVHELRCGDLDEDCQWTVAAFTC
eukprot:5695523-Amphidinium_carterae.2